MRLPEHSMMLLHDFGDSGQFEKLCVFGSRRDVINLNVSLHPLPMIRYH